jgi:hypothetical protein
VNVTNYFSVDRRVVNQSVPPDKIGRAVGHAVPRYRLEPVAEPVARGGGIDGDRLVVYRPDPRRGGGPQRRDVPPGHDGERPYGRGGIDHDQPAAVSSGTPSEDEPALMHGPHSHPSRSTHDWPQTATGHGNPHNRPPVNSRPPMTPPQATPSHPAPVPASPAHGGGPTSRPNSPGAPPAPAPSAAPSHAGASSPQSPAPASNQPRVPPGQAKKQQKDERAHDKGHGPEKDCSKPNSQGCNPQ